ncbi:MAG: hypothetical protein Q9176_004222 [Flavoplaca citrina]
MLLSSAIPHHQHIMPHLQPLYIPPPYSPFDFETPQYDRPASPALTALQSTCRSLQALIASSHQRPQAPRMLRTAATLQSPIDLRASCDAARVRKMDGKKKRVHKAQPTGRMRVEKRPMKVNIPSQTLDQRRKVEDRKRMEAPRTPVGQCAVSPMMAPRGPMEDEAEPVLRSRRTDRTGNLEMQVEVEDESVVDARTVGVGETAGRRRKMELSRYDEALVGLLLKQLRLHGGGGRRR